MTKREDGVFVEFVCRVEPDNDCLEPRCDVNVSAARCKTYREDWWYVGVVAVAKIRVTTNGYATTYEMRSPGLWGVENDVGKERLTEIFEDECEILRNDLALIGAHFKPKELEYVIVEYSGTVKECECDRFSSLDEAYSAMKRDYASEEIESWPVKIAVDRGDGNLSYDY